MSKRTYITFAVIMVIIIAVIIVLYIFYETQHKYIFKPEKLDEDHVFEFEDYENVFEELWFDVDPNVKIHGLLFKRITDQGLPLVSSSIKSNRNLVFYLHGNAGNLDLWGRIAPLYTYHDSDVFILDYRGYGKSQGHLTYQHNLLKDVDIVYDYFKERYIESNITIGGYSIGTGIAAYLASKNSPKQLILHAPYYSLIRLIGEHIPYIPPLLISFKLKTFKYIENATYPIYIFHDVDDDVISVEHSKDLAELFTKDADKLFLLNGAGHDGINQNLDYQQYLKTILLE